MKLKKLKYVVALVFITMAGIVYSCKHDDESDIISLDNTNNNPETNESLQEEESIQEPEIIIYVHICGAVNNPDVYAISQNTRLYELVKLAGGFTNDAANNYINQATVLTDGQQIYIPTKEEVEDLEFQTPIDQSKETASEKININTASKEELMTLTGIGESKANSIIDYRQKNGNFKSIEDIMKISGIKDSVFSKISEDITVD